MRILLAGSSGFLGTRLVERLTERGHDVVRLVRRPARSAVEVSWQPSGGQLDPAAVAAADAVVNLAGVNVGARRWTSGFRNRIRASRVDTTGTLAGVIAHLPAADRPRVMLNASAIGYYGENGDRPLTEESPAGTDFLADVCRVWEAAARPAEDAGTRVVPLRTGLPLDARGGVLKPQMPLFRAGLGTRIGNGRQWMPWIAMADWLDAVEFLLEREDIAGPVNVVAPEPARNAEFAAALGRVLHRPAVLFVPGFALHAALGGYAGEALKSQRVLPGVLGQAGFHWSYPALEPALRAAIRPATTAAA